MKNNFQKVLSLLPLLTILGLIFPATPVKADMGIAPPSMHFTLEYQIIQTAIVDTEILICDNAQCNEYQIIETRGGYSYSIPNFYCGGKNNSEWCYAGIGNSRFGKYHRISLVFEDGVTRVSNVFKKMGYSSYYTVVVTKLDLIVQENVLKSFSLNMFSPIQVICFIPSAILTVLVETKAAKLYSKKLNKPISRIVLANLISLPIVWFIIPYWLEIKFLWVLIIVEIFAIIFEAVFIYYTNRSSGITLKESVKISLITNFSSIGIEVLLLGLLFLIFFIFIR